jgi:hypothetical protein
VADVTALKAIVGQADLDAVLVAGQGLYDFVAADATTELLPWIVQPTTGGGRWRLIVPLADGTGRLPPVAVQNARMACAYHQFADFTSNSTVAVDVPGSNFSIANVAIGDILRVHYNAGLATTRADGYYKLLKLVITRPDATTDPTSPTTAWEQPDTTPDEFAPADFFCTRAAAQAGTYAFKLTAQVQNVAARIDLSFPTYFWEQIRP